jgi:hypothetical protein
VVLSVVNGVMERGVSGLRRQAGGLVEPAEERNAVEEEPELGGDERRAEEDEHGGEPDPHPVAALALRPGRDSDDERESDGEREPQRGHRVERLGVEVRLVDPEVDDGTERDRDDARSPQRSVQPRPGEADESDPDQREREVERDELPPEATGNGVAVVDVVELGRREARVRRDHRDAVEHDECQHRLDLPGDAAQLSSQGGQLPARWT